jgi:pimeloyl-ACP methyl ester carboxylesterase
VLDICAALHLHRVIAIGTSFGGLLSMGIAAARPSLVRAVVLNDIGPELGDDGTEFVRRFVGNDTTFADIDAAIAYLRAVLPPMSLQDDAAWRTMATLTYAPDDTGILRPLWDTRIARLMNGSRPDLWPLFAGIADLPLLLVHGEASNILLPATVARMRAMRPDMALARLPGIGHAPTLMEPEVLQPIRTFLHQCEGCNTIAPLGAGDAEQPSLGSQ